MFKKIYIEITNVCNLKCKFCPDTKRIKGFMKVNEFENVINKIRNYTNLVCLHVKGEPLLHPELLEILKVLDKYNLKANITTNGTLLKDKIGILKQVNSVRQLNISLHAITQNNNIDKNYLNNIFNSQKELENIIVSYRLWNLEDIKNNDINDEILDSISNFYDIKNLKQELLKKDFLKIKDNLFINQDVKFDWPKLGNDIIIEKGRCLALKDQIAILVDGTVVPCCLDNDGDIKLGNIFMQSLEDILNSEKTNTIKTNFENSIITCELCKTCGFLKRLENKRG